MNQTKKPIDLFITSWDNGFSAKYPNCRIDIFKMNEDMFVIQFKILVTEETAEKVKEGTNLKKTNTHHFGMWILNTTIGISSTGFSVLGTLIEMMIKKFFSIQKTS